MSSELERPPKVSVLMTTLNSERFVREAVNSILNQHFVDFELIIVDGGSDDDTEQIIQEIIDGRIKLFVSKGLRRSDQLNYAFEKSRGAFIVIMDSDDIAALTRLSEQVSFLNLHPHISIVGSWARLISESGNLIGHLKRPISHKAITKNLLAMNGISFPTIIFRREVFDTAGPFVEGMAPSEDIEWLLRCEQVCRLSNISKELMQLRQTKLSRSRSTDLHNPKLVGCMEKTLQKATVSLHSSKQKASWELNYALIHYYHGDMTIARNHIKSSFAYFPFDILTFRYFIATVLIPAWLFKRLRQNKSVKMLTSLFRKLSVWKDMNLRKPTP